MDSDDRALLRDWKTQRDAESLDKLVRKYARIVHAAALRITQNRTDAEDIAQESFIALVRTPPPDDTHLAAWLHRVATRKAIDARRSKFRRHEREEKWSMREPDAPQADPEALANARGEIDAAIDALPDLQRTAIILHFMEGFTHERIAEAEGVSRPAVTQRIGNGLDALRKRLAPQGAAINDVALMGLIALPPATGIPLSPDSYARIRDEIAKQSKQPTVKNIGMRRGLWSRAGIATKFAALAAVTLALVGAGVYWTRSSKPEPILARPVISSAPERTPTPEQKPVAPPPSVEPAAPIAVQVATENAPAPAEAAPAVTTGASIAGRIFDRETGANLAGVVVHIEGYALSKETWVAGAPKLRMTTDANGHYETGSLPEGAYSITLDEFPGYPLTKAGQSRKTTELMAGNSGPRKVDFSLARSGSLAGRITINGTPIADMTVILDSSPTLDIQQLVSDKDGNYLVDGLGEYKGSLRARGQVSGTLRATPYVTAHIAPGKTTHADFEFLAGTSSIEGNVYYHRRDGKTDTAPGKVVVTYAYVDGNEYNIENMDLNTDPDGHFLVESLWGGRVTVGLYPSLKFGRQRHTFELKDGERARQDFHFYDTLIDVRIRRMPADKELDVWLVALPGHIETFEGTPAQQRDFVESQQRAIGSVGTEANGEGWGAIAGLEPGEYTIIAAGVLGSHTLINHAAGEEFYRRRRTVRAYATLPEDTGKTSLELSFPEEK